MEKLAGARRAPRRRWAVAIGAGSVLTVAGIIAFAMPAFANHVSDLSANCNEVVVSFTDFPSNNTPVHIAIQVGSESTSANVNVNENTPPQHVNIMNLTSQLNGQSANVVVDVTWFLDTNHHEHGSFPVTCGNEETSTTAPATTVAPTSIQQTTTTTVPVTVTTGGGQVTTTSVGPATTAATESTTTTSIVTSPVTATTGSTSAVSANEASLPFTGGASLPLVVVGLALIIGGAAAVIAPRYRRRSSES